MTDTVENLILEHLKRFQTGQDNINRKLDELIRRTSNLEAGQASIIQRLGHLAAADASHPRCFPGFPNCSRIFHFICLPPPFFDCNTPGRQ
jgi:hypothetical protein